MKHLPFFFISLLILVLLYACSSTNEKPSIKGSKYYPLTVGNSWTYNVSEIIFDTTIQDIVNAYQQKFEITNSFINQLGETNYVMYVSTRIKDNDKWIYKETWSVRVSDANEVIVSEENVPYVTLIFPLKDGTTWNGNKYNGLPLTNNQTNNFKIVKFQKPYNEFINTVTVEEANELNFVFKDSRYSVYAEGVGLVYRINSKINYCNDQSDGSNCFGFYIRVQERTKIETLVEHVVQ